MTAPVDDYLRLLDVTRTERNAAQAERDRALEALAGLRSACEHVRATLTPFLAVGYTQGVVPVAQDAARTLQAALLAHAPKQEATAEQRRQAYAEVQDPNGFTTDEYNQALDRAMQTPKQEAPEPEGLLDEEGFAETLEARPPLPAPGTYTLDANGAVVPTKPRLAANLPVPRKLSDEEMRQCTEEASASQLKRMTTALNKRQREKDQP